MITHAADDAFDRSGDPPPSVVAHTVADAPPPAASVGQRARAYAVHAFTASGVVFAFLAAAEVCQPTPDPRLVFVYVAIQVLIDAADGPLARAWQVKRFAPAIDGRTIDDIVDYLTYTFVPLLLVWRLNWVPDPAGLWVGLAMVASLFGFANTGAKDERGGFFLGFPSYWNIVALYLGLMRPLFGPWPGGLLVVALAVLTVLPVKFVYPNLAPHPWRWPTLIGGLLWAVMLAAMLPAYPHPPGWLVALSLVYPALYVGLSVWLAGRASRAASASAGLGEAGS
jgi:phosphatidylcholine synthase